MKCLAVYGRDVQKFITVDRMRELRVDAFSWLSLGEIAVLGWRDEEGRGLYLTRVSTITDEPPLHLMEVPFEVPAVGY